MPTKAQTKPEPPTAAVAADAHWAATRERLRNRQRPTSKMTICDDEDAKTALSQAKFRLERIKAAAEDADTPDNQAALAAAQADLEAAQAAFDNAAIVLRFQALERKPYMELIQAHPPTEEQAEDGSPWNENTFCPALIAAASLNGITEEDAAHYMEEWAQGEAVTLWNTAYGVQTDVSRLDVGKG